MALDWKRILDCEHNGRPVYEYEAVDNGIRYHIYWSCDAGFGLSISYYDGRGNPPDAPTSIAWWRALYRCKEAAERYRGKHSEAEAA